MYIVSISICYVVLHNVMGTTVLLISVTFSGKPHGHDVDLLLTNPDGTVADTLLNTLLIQLHKQVCTHVHQNVCMYDALLLNTVYSNSHSKYLTF